MFRIGEFSHLARVTTKLLRHYDRIGLLPPSHVDADNGYRYYSADQLPRLNRILALQEMGFSLDEIADLVEAEVPAAELQGMLTLRRHDLQRQLEADLVRLRLVEARLAAIDAPEPEHAVDFREKQLEPLSWISHRFSCSDPAHAHHLAIEIEHLSREVAEAAPAPRRLAIGYGDYTDVEIDLAIGIIVEPHPAPPAGLTLADGTTLSFSTLPTATAVTGVRIGYPQLTPGFYSDLGRWLAAHDATIAGPVRELFLRPPDPANDLEPIVEVQFPITPAATPER